jgi:hypothetical protein
VGCDCGVIVSGEDAAEDVGGVVSVAAICDVAAFGLGRRVFVVAGSAFIQMGGVGETAAGELRIFDLQVL